MVVAFTITEINGKMVVAFTITDLFFDIVVILSYVYRPAIKICGVVVMAVLFV